MLTRRHFTRIAREIRRTRERASGLEGERALDLLTDSLCEIFPDENPRFDAERFREATEIDSDAEPVGPLPPSEYEASVLIGALESWAEEHPTDAATCKQLQRSILGPAPNGEPK